MTTLVLFLVLAVATTVLVRRDLARAQVLTYDAPRNAWCSRAGVVRVTDEDLWRVTDQALERVVVGSHTIALTITIDTSGFDAAMARASASAERLADRLRGDQ